MSRTELLNKLPSLIQKKKKKRTEGKGIMGAVKEEYTTGLP